MAWYAWEGVHATDIDLTVHGWHRVPTVFYSPESCESWAGTVMALDHSEIFACEPGGKRPELRKSSSPSQ